MKKIVIGLGEVLWDMLPSGKQLGGAPANFAYHAGQFGYDALAVSAIGKDALGEETIAALENKNLNYIIPKVDFPTGTVGVTLDADGVPTYDITRDVAWDNVPFTSEMENAAKNCMAVCFGSLAQRNKVSHNTIKSFIKATPKECMRIFDINLRQNFYTKELIEESLKMANVLKINDEELVKIIEIFKFPASLPTDELCKKLLSDYNLNIVVLTCGTLGSDVYTKNYHSYQPTPKVEVADTVGAGDSFTGAFCAAMLSGKSVEVAHRLAVKVSAYVCTQKGAMPVIPDELKDEVNGIR